MSQQQHKPAPSYQPDRSFSSMNSKSRQNLTKHSNSRGEKIAYNSAARTPAAYSFQHEKNKTRMRSSQNSEKERKENIQKNNRDLERYLD